MLSHLGSGAEITLAGLEAALTGADGRGPDFNQSVWDRWNAKSPAEQAADFVTANEALVSRYETSTRRPASRCASTWASCPQPVDLATAAGHAAQRVRPAQLGRPGRLRPGRDRCRATRPRCCSTGPALMFGFLGHADALERRAGTLAVHLSEPDRALRRRDRRRDRARPTSRARPDGVLTAPAEAWLRLIAGRLGPEYTPASVTVTGDLVSLADLRAGLPRLLAR